MKKKYIYYGALFFLFSSCSDFLDIKPLDKIDREQVFQDVNGVKAVLATLYNQMPVEDFLYNPDKWFNYRFESGGWVDLGWSTSFYTDESTNSVGSNVEITTGYWEYGTIRQINQFIESVPEVNIPQEEKNRLLSEAYFIRAYTYFAMAKRYGGLPIITRVQQIDEGDKLYVPRSTERETWNFILEELDRAIEFLPSSVDPIEGSKRATVWAAYALKSRVALHAASVAKYWNKAPLIGEAVDLKLVGGFSQDDIMNYYRQCIEASDFLIKNSGKSLYKPLPSSVDEAALNYQKIFEDPTNSEVLNEVIFSKGYIDGTQSGEQGHNTDIFFNPAQTNTGFWTYGRFSPVLDLVDIYESYDNDGIRQDAKLVTRTDGVEDYYIANPSEGIDLNLPFKKYDDMVSIFNNKDARLSASIILPGSLWKNVKIIMQGGVIDQLGNQYIYVDKEIEKDNLLYYSYGAKNPNEYSGFKNIGERFDYTNYTITGFSLKKFLQESNSVAGAFLSSKTDYIDMRLAEVYLNYAEAVVESGLGDANLAKKYLNDIRRRAAHTDEIPLTLDNVLKERRVELAFEGHRYWDMIRRRDSHLIFNGSTVRKALVPILDLRESTPKYIFVRANSYYDNRNNGRRFNEKTYYLAIPGIENNHLIQNPQY